MTPPYRHNGGVWPRADIPTATLQHWNCTECGKDISEQAELYQEQVGYQLVDRVRYIPVSRYWHGLSAAVFCSVECSVKTHDYKFQGSTDLEVVNSIL